MRFWKALGLLFLYALLLAAVYVCHVRYFGVEVVLYSAIVDALIAAAILALVVAIVPQFRLFSNFEKSLLVLVAILLGYIFAITVPTVIDRSLSLYLLEQLDEQGGSLPHEAFEGSMLDRYAEDMKIIDVRITEQTASGTVVLNDGVVTITPRGKFAVAVSRFWREHFLNQSASVVR